MDKKVKNKLIKFNDKIAEGYHKLNNMVNLYGTDLELEERKELFNILKDVESGLNKLKTLINKK